MAMTLAARYTPGEWTALVTAHGTALLHPKIDAERVQAVWLALGEGRGVSGCLEVLAVGGFADLPPFALVQHGDGEFRVLVRGEVSVTAGESTVGATGIATWRETLLAGTSYRISIAGDGGGHLQWPLAGGVVLASGVEWLGSQEKLAEAEAEADSEVEAEADGGGAADADSEIDAGEADVAEVAGVAAAGVAAADAAEGEDAGAAVLPDASAEAVTVAEDAAEESEESAEASAAEGEPLEDNAPEAADPSSSTPAGALEAQELPGEADSEGAESPADAEDADSAADAEELAPDEAVAEQSPEDSAQTPAEEDDDAGEVAGQAADGTGAAPSLASSGNDIIDSLPWAVSATDRAEAHQPPEPAGPGAQNPTAAAETPGAESALAEDDLEHTIISRPGQRPGGLPPGAPIVTGPSEPGPASSTPPTAGAPATQESAAGGSPAVNPPWQPPVDMSRPAGPVPAYGRGDVEIGGDHDGETIMASQLPRDQDMTIVPGMGESDLYDEPGQHSSPQQLSLSVSTGAEVPLDRSVLIGRAPESARFNAGVQPRLVTVPSPEQDISRTHVEIRAEAGSAVVTDLNSTNGTVLIQPGNAPRRLHAGEGASVPVGTIIDLGDGITVNIHAVGEEAG